MNSWPPGVFWAKNKIKKYLGYIWVLWCFAILFIVYPWYQFVPFLLNIKHPTSKNSRCTPVKKNWTMLWMPPQLQLQYETDTTTRRGKLLISKQKTLSTFSIFCMTIFFIENGSNCLFLDKPGSSELSVSFYLNFL